MVQRRTRALAELLTSALLLPIFIRIWKFQFDHADEGDEPSLIQCSHMLSLREQ